MNSVVEEIQSYYGFATYLEEEGLMHYGMPRRSGRYPYGSGENPYQHGRDFLGRVEELKKDKFTFTDPKDGKTYSGDTAIAKSMGLTTSEYRRQISWATYERRLQDVARVKSLKADGLGNTEIGRIMGINESTVRSLLDGEREGRMHEAMQTVNYLRAQLEEKGMIDVGSDVANELNISKERLDLAIDYLEKAEGCPVYKGGIPQPTNPGQQTNQRVLCLPGTEHKEIYEYGKVKTITDYISRDGGTTYEKKFYYPSSMDSKRLMIRYDEEGGLERDGIIELRRGVDDLSLGESRYSQVRILVDGTHYMKGMAVYSDDMPDGVDVIFNTNKAKGTPMTKVLKEIKSDPDNPFGSAIKDVQKGGQYWYDADTGKRCSANDPNVKNKKLGLINKRSDEGDWSEWKDALPSQFLGKQSKAMAQKQLDLAKADKLAEFDEYCSITNPTIKKHMLKKFAESCDSAAVNLQAAALPGQKYHVIIPVNSLKDTEVYAPKYENGTKLALIRYPHGGTFEIPILTVNNKHPEAKKLLGGDIQDAVGINKTVADRLSGADFDGDTVMCIPTHDPKGRVKITSTKELEGLKGFDPKLQYKAHDTKTDADGTVHYYRNGMEYPIMKNTGTEMGIISNLITDMTLAGASPDKLARAVRHSMVVIDAEKHKLDYKASEVENNIRALKKEYQPKENGRYGGASTILSKAKGVKYVDKHQGSYKVNMPDNDDFDPSRPIGAKIWKKADDLYTADKVKYDKNTKEITYRTVDGKKITYRIDDPEAKEKYAPIRIVDKETGVVTYSNKAGDIQYKVATKTMKTTQMEDTDDANTLVSAYRHPMELIYADYANSMKALGNQARVEMKTTKKIEYSATAKATYSEEVKSLDGKLKKALLNAPREREVMRLANAEVNAKKLAGEIKKADEIKKASQQAVVKYRQEVGAVARRDRNIDITDREWEAIQAGAISESTLEKILNNTDIDVLRERATPKTYSSLSSAQVARAKALAASNYTLSEISKKMGVSASTISTYLKGVK